MEKDMSVQLQEVQSARRPSARKGSLVLPDGKEVKIVPTEEEAEALRKTKSNTLDSIEEFDVIVEGSPEHVSIPIPASELML
jgi:hypothetical protein